MKMHPLAPLLRFCGQVNGLSSVADLEHNLAWLDSHIYLAGHAKLLTKYRRLSKKARRRLCERWCEHCGMGPQAKANP